MSRGGRRGEGGGGREEGERGGRRRGGMEGRVDVVRKEGREGREGGRRKKVGGREGTGKMLLIAGATQW